MARTVLLRRVLWGGVVLGLLVYLALTLWLVLAALFFPYQLDYGEGIVLWFTHQLALGQSIYKGMEGMPYASSNYPPLAMVLAIPFQVIFGDSYFGGRLLNIASALISAVLIYRIVSTEAHDDGPGTQKIIGARAAAGMVALFFIGSTFVYHWAPLFRIDLIGLAFTLLGVFFVWRWERIVSRVAEGGAGSWNLGAGDASASTATRYLVLAALFFLCAVYTKHSLVFAPAAAVAAIFLRVRRTAIILGIGLAVSGGLIFLVLNGLTGGGFAFGLIDSNATLWLWSTFLAQTESFLITYLVLILISIYAWVGRVRSKKIGILEIYAVLAILSLILAGRVGAFENYFFEAIFAVCVFAGIGFEVLLRRGERTGDVLAIVLLAQLMLFWPNHNPGIALALMNAVAQGNQEVGPLVRAANGTVISEDMGLLVTNGRPVDYYTFQYSSLARAGKWDQHWELENLRAGNFPLVILFRGTREDVDLFRNFTREFVSALDYSYAVSLADERYVVYSPSPLAHIRGDDFGGQLDLVGWSLAPDSGLAGGETCTLTVVWQAKVKLGSLLKTFAHIENTSSGVIAQDDHEPMGGIYPTIKWAANEMVRETYTLRPRKGVTPGEYSLRVGWYDVGSQDRLQLQGGADYVELAKLQIK